MSNTIHTGSHVSLQYKLSVDGATIEDSRKSRPLKYIHGKGKLLPGFVKRLEGLRVGDERNFELAPDEAHGARSTSAVREIPKSKFPEGIEPTIGMTLNWKGRSGKSIPCKVSGVHEDSIFLDNNHPMAGKTLVVEVKILTVE